MTEKIVQMLIELKKKKVIFTRVAELFYLFEQLMRIVYRQRI